MAEDRLVVRGMHCSACKAGIERAVRGLGGVSAASVNLMAGTLTVTHDEAVAPLQAIRATVDGLGYQALTEREAAAGRQGEAAELA
ncbi:MAG: cation transporter, partial [Succinivibrionaceae bacterium]|nr:cation transporter [Succinivibrionaceae bacterium]